MEEEDALNSYSKFANKFSFTLFPWDEKIQEKT